MSMKKFQKRNSISAISFEVAEMNMEETMKKECNKQQKEVSEYLKAVYAEIERLQGEARVLEKVYSDLQFWA